MINRREKLQLFNKLRGENHAQADLSLLEDEQPRHPKLARFSRDPKRYSDEILYALLDFCDEEEITDNREYYENTDDSSSNTSTESGQGLLGGSSNTSTKEGKKPSDASSDTLTKEEAKEPSDDSSVGPSDAPVDNPADTPSDTPSDTPEGDAPPEPDDHDAAGQDEDSKKK